MEKRKKKWRKRKGKEERGKREKGKKIKRNRKRYTRNRKRYSGIQNYIIMGYYRGWEGLRDAGLQMKPKKLSRSCRNPLKEVQN